MFVDRVTIEVRGGDGGDGCLGFRREFKVPKGGPDGGDGGHGGNVVIRAGHNVDSLAALVGQKHFRAERGSNGSGSHKHGRSGQDVVIDVPVGTLVIDAASGQVMRDLAQPGDQIVVGRGGRGGRGNAFFKSATNRAPRQVEQGAPGEVRTVTLELKLIADVGLLGMPNAGKSTLLSRLSRARPEIADYPFTTRTPMLGIVSVGPDRQFVLADIPGLIEGAHAGVGLGHEFLRHVERTRLLVHLVEPAPMDGGDPVRNYLAIREELRLHDPALADRPEIVAVSKCELPQAADVRAQLEARTGVPVQLISAVTGKGLPELLGRIVSVLDATSNEAVPSGAKL